MAVLQKLLSSNQAVYTANFLIESKNGLPLLYKVRDSRDEKDPQILTQITVLPGQDHIFDPLASSVTHFHHT